MERWQELDAAAGADAHATLSACCGSSRWTGRMLARRPFGSRDALLTAAREEWWALSPDDWLEAFSHHPRIGDSTATGVAAAEQAGAQGAGTVVQDELRRVNQAYEEKFGHIYIVCATGKSADEMLEIARQRMNNDPATELRISAEEQRRIMHVRLRKLLGDET